MKDNNESWYKLMHYVPGQIVIEKMPERPRIKPRPVYEKTVKEEARDIKEEIIIRDAEETLTDELITDVIYSLDIGEESMFELLSGTQETRSQGGCPRTPRNLRKMVYDARSKSNESDTTAEISFSLESFDNSGTITSSIMMGEGSNI
ncbi:MAG: hypothetical protein N4A31_01850 [Rickettsiales bacterium]|jgi:hypothetical protein|nr:hypothetical protein [Rickettsiales bacterium]